MSETATASQGTPTRPLLRRLLRYREWLIGAQGFTVRQAIEELEVCERTVYRDIAYLRTLGWDVEFCRQRRRWVLASEGAPLPVVSLREEEVTALRIAEQALRRLEGTTHAEALRSALEKLAPLLEAPGSLRGESAPGSRLPAPGLETAAVEPDARQPLSPSPPRAASREPGAVGVAEIVLCFSGAVARQIRGRTWPGPAAAEELPDGRLVVKLQSAANAELLRLALQYGAEVEVLAPESLRRQVAGEHRRALSLYDARFRENLSSDPAAGGREV